MMATHSYKHATTRLGRVTQIFLHDDDGTNSVTVVQQHLSKSQVEREIGVIHKMRADRLSGADHARR